MGKTIAMIPAAGRGSRMMSLTEDNPKAMLPLHNKPLIAWHLDKLIEEEIQKVIIIVGYKKEKLIEYVNKFYSNKIDIVYVEQKELKGLAHAIKYGFDYLSYEELENDRLLIILGDTIIKDSLADVANEDYSWIGYKEVNDYKRWCLMTTEDDQIVNFIDKPDYDPNTRKAVIGIYYFHDINTLSDCITEIIDKDIKIKNEYQLSSAMELYMNEYSLCPIEFNDWYDCGEVETFNNTRKNIARNFNSIKVTDDNTIIKSSPSNNEKIIQEINWYTSLPNKLKIYTPQLIEFNKNENNIASYELEYINFTPMQELFLYNLPDLSTWKNLFDNIFHMIEKFKNYSDLKNDTYDNSLETILIDKTKDRIKKLIDQNQIWKTIMEKSFITVNGKAYKNLSFVLPDIYEKVEGILKNNDKYWQIIHGDLFFGNMLYDINSNTLKVIDPRGNFGKDGIYGDIRYDLAKLNHSIYGKYDFIVNGLYSLTYNNTDFNYIIYDNNRHMNVHNVFKQKLKDYNYNYNEILIITSLLFASMIPLHNENLNNQIMMYLTATKIMNEILYGGKYE